MLGHGFKAGMQFIAGSGVQGSPVYFALHLILELIKQRGAAGGIESCISTNLPMSSSLFSGCSLIS